MTITTKRRLYRSVIFGSACLSLLEAVGESFFTGPFREYYFPSHGDRCGTLRLVCLVAAALAGFAEGYWLVLYRQFTPRA